MSYINIKSITKNYGKNRVLDDINVEINKGEFVSLLGPSGCGKTTLLRIICGLEKLNSGSISVGDKEITNLSPSKRELGIVFQNYVLFPNLTVFENIAYGLVNKKEKKEVIKQKVTDILKKVDLLHIKDKYPKQLSGGQQQRIALARAVVLEPKILLLDEPLSALDAKVRESLRREIKTLQEELNITTIMVTHDQEEALTMSDKIVVMNKAKVMQIGTPEEIYNKPKNDFVADFIGTVNIIRKDNKEISVRPEEFLISKDMIKDYEEVKIKNIEFRGAFYRVTCFDKSNLEIIVDIQSSEKENLNLQVNNLLYIKVNKI
ncbi:ABC transporter ATP-binding protein [Clostridium chrysemydis]|uniref:ABC transporter ATP-binding protein n=1 Tax=Clostridium chrysemydis TaxID=2665504 RepID=UPI003F2E7578